jgi:hypothetical protein
VISYRDDVPEDAELRLLIYESDDEDVVCFVLSDSSPLERLSSLPAGPDRIPCLGREALNTQMMNLFRVTARACSRNKGPPFRFREAFALISRFDLGRLRSR